MIHTPARGTQRMAAEALAKRANGPVTWSLSSEVAQANEFTQSQHRIYIRRLSSWTERDRPPFWPIIGALTVTGTYQYIPVPRQRPES